MEIGRTEFGVPRTNCDCGVCVRNCAVMPGYLIPADLPRMIPPNVDEFKWAEENLLASPGALAMKDGIRFRIPTLVPAVKEDGSCIHLSAEGTCGIHDISPFGCAFFDCGPERPKIVHASMIQIQEAIEEKGLYLYLWIHLSYKGLEQLPPEILRRRM